MGPRQARGAWMALSMTPLRLSIVVTVASAASMALEIVASRMIAPYVGMSLYTWTAVIAVVLAGLALGHWVGGMLAGRRRALFAVLAAGAVTAFATQFLLRGLAGGVLGAFDPVSGVVVLTTLVFFLPSLFAGAVGPMATFLALESCAEGQQGRVLGRMYALGAVGAIAGVLGSGLLSIPFIGSVWTVAVVAVAYAASAMLVTRGPVRIAAGIAALGMLAATAAFGASWTPCHRESGYFCIRVDDVTASARVLALDHLAHGVNERDDPTRLHSPYVALIDELAKRRFGEAGPEAAFFIGGGAYTLPRAWAARWPSSDLVVAEIDPAVTAMARERLWVDPGAFEVRHADARLALASETRRFDAIVGDAFADISIPPHLVSDEFHAEIAARLTPSGFYAMNVVDLLRHPRFLTSLAETLQRRFGSVELWLDRSAVSAEEARTTWIVVASRTPTAVARLGDGGGREWVRVPLDRMLKVVPDSQRIFLTDDHAPVARLLGPLLRQGRYSE